MQSGKTTVYILIFFFFLPGLILTRCERLKLQSCVYVGQAKERFCPEGLSGRENIDRQQLHFGSVIAFHTCVIQTAVAKHNKCKPTAILTAALLFCAGQIIQLIVLTFQFMSLKCLLQTRCKEEKILFMWDAQTQRGLQISFLIKTVTKQQQSVCGLCVLCDSFSICWSISLASQPLWLLVRAHMKSIHHLSFGA